MARNALGLEFGSAAKLSKRPGSVWSCLWGNALKRSPGIIRKSRVSYPGPGFQSSATWPSLPKKHYNGLNQTCIFANGGDRIEDARNRFFYKIKQISSHVLYMPGLIMSSSVTLLKT